MASNAKVVSSWAHNGQYFLSVRPDPPAPDSDTEYLGSTPLLDEGGKAKGTVQLATEALASARASRAANQSKVQHVPDAIGPVQL